jgi:hypothetical protein
MGRARVLLVLAVVFAFSVAGHAQATAAIDLIFEDAGTPILTIAPADRPALQQRIEGGETAENRRISTLQKTALLRVVDGGTQ